MSEAKLEMNKAAFVSQSALNELARRFVYGMGSHNARYLEANLRNVAKNSQAMYALWKALLERDDDGS